MSIVLFGKADALLKGAAELAVRLRVAQDDPDTRVFLLVIGEVITEYVSAGVHIRRVFSEQDLASADLALSQASDYVAFER